MADPILYANFQNTEFPAFNVFYGTCLLKDTTWFDGPVADWVPKYTDSPNKFLYFQPIIFLVTQGSVKFENKKCNDIFTKGQGLSSVRMSGRYRMSALEDNTSIVCMTPKNKVIYNRTLINLNSNEEYKIEAQDTNVYYFVASGKITINGVEKSQTNMINVEANIPVTIQAIEDSYIIKIWK
jgi:hypothetical protein